LLGVGATPSQISAIPRFGIDYVIAGTENCFKDEKKPLVLSIPPCGIQNPVTSVMAGSVSHASLLEALGTALLIPYAMHVPLNNPALLSNDVHVAAKNFAARRPIVRYFT
jgi:hypothetical protein